MRLFGSTDHRIDDTPIRHDSDIAATPTEAVEVERLRWERDQALQRADRLERARRRGRLQGLGLLLVLIAVVGAAGIFLAVRQGSFASGGAVIDQKLAEAAQPARDAAAVAAERSGAAVERAGRNLEAQGQKLKDAAR